MKKAKTTQHMDNPAFRKQMKRDYIEQNLPRLGNNPTYGAKLEHADRLADLEIFDASLDEAKEVFIEHWFRATAALRTIAIAGGAELIRDIIPLIENPIGSLCVARKKHPAIVGPSVFRAAQCLCYDVQDIVQENPSHAWLADYAAAEYVVPWLMINGKPAPGFPDFVKDAHHWGYGIIKRGKNRFDAPQTRVVASTLHYINRIRTHPLSEAMLQDKHDWREGLQTKFPDAERDWVTLPPLTRKTKTKWWPFVVDEIRIWWNLPLLSIKERRSILATLDYKTESSLMNEFLKRCKVAFNGLCPTK